MKNNHLGLLKYGFGGVPPTADFQTFFAHLPIHISLQDQQHRFTAVSEPVSTICGFKAPDQMLGLTNAELKCPVAEFSEGFDKDSAEVMASRESSQLIGVYGPYSDGEIRAWICDRHPFYGESGVVSGTVTHASLLTSTAIQRLFQEFIFSDQFFQGSDSIFRNYRVFSDYSKTLLTSRELECLFFTLRGKTSSEIGELLYLSSRTVESYLANIRSKFGVQNKSQLIETAIQEGFLTQVPKTLLCRLF